MSTLRWLRDKGVRTDQRGVFIEGRRIPFGKPMIGAAERRAVDNVLRQPVLTHGPRVEQFERDFAEFTGAPYAIATSSCMAALHLAYMALGIGPGDEVIVPALTHVATAHAVTAVGATPVFCDSDETGNIDPIQLRSLVTDRTQAICVVHYLGLPADMKPIKLLAAEAGVFLVEDCALALGAKVGDTHVGLLGDIGCFSFYPVKHITTGEGGMAITNRKWIAERLAKQRAFGIDKTNGYDVTMPGLNYRMTEVAAAIGIEQLKRLPGFLDVRQRNYRQLAEALNLEVIDTDDHGDRRSSHYSLMAYSRDRLADELRQRGIETSVYYAKPLPETSFYRHLGASCPQAARISEQGIAFPIGPHVGESDIEGMIG